ncbi:MAG: ABC transporter permease [Acidobacteria bacterium]|nr:MAG: ABC transporter permease [Acidobacteriota bacterium]
MTAVVRRLLAVPLLLVGAATLVFFLIHLVPGDPAAAMLGEGASPADVAALRSDLGLDRPVPVQYARWLGGLLRGDLGVSFVSQRSVTKEILRALPATGSLAVAAFLAALLVAVPAGVAGALFTGRALDHVLRGVSLLGVSTPSYVSAPILVLVFSVGLGLLPVSGRDAPFALVLPAVTLGLTMAALLSRMIRASLLEELSRPYVLAARARGEGRFGAALRHAGRNALPPVLVVAGLQFGSLLTGAVVTETIFAWPGIGRLLVQSIQRRDYPLVQGCVLFIAFVYTVVNAAVDVLAVALDPRAAARSAGPEPEA